MTPPRKITVADIAAKLKISNEDAIAKLRRRGIDVSKSDDVVDRDELQAYITGKRAALPTADSSKPPAEDPKDLRGILLAILGELREIREALDTIAGSSDAADIVSAIQDLSWDLRSSRDLSLAHLHNLLSEIAENTR